MAREITMLFLLASMIVGALSASTSMCGENEEISECDSLCPPNCEKIDDPHMCIMACGIGCQCKHGYLRNKHGECVKPEDCDL